MFINVTDHGSCVDFETCECHTGWNGSACNTPDCSSRNDCNGKGLCLTPDTCDCFNGYDGIDCSITSPPNVNPPQFNKTEYNVAIFDHTKVGTVLADVLGYDTDSGSNGRLRYSINLVGVTIDIARYIMIDNLSGQITLIEAITHEVIPSGRLTLSLVVSDKGSPPLSDTSVLNIKLFGKNDHCPVFTSPLEGDMVSVNSSITGNDTLFSVHANDADIGLEGQISYSLHYNDTNLEIDEKLGNVSLVSEEISVGNYSMTIVATDHGIKPCLSNITVVLNVYNATLTPEL